MSFETIGHAPIMTCRKVREVKHVRKTIKASEYNHEIIHLLNRPKPIEQLMWMLNWWVEKHEKAPAWGPDDVRVRIYKHFLETGEKYIDEGTDNQAIVDF